MAIVENKSTASVALIGRDGEGKAMRIHRFAAPPGKSEISDELLAKLDECAKTDQALVKALKLVSIERPKASAKPKEAAKAAKG